MSFSKTACALAAALMCCAGAAAATVEYNVAPPDAPLGYWGTGKKENYDVAVHIAENALTGSSIKGFTCPLHTDEGLGNLRGWLSTKLEVNASTFTPDIAVADATLDDDLMLTVSFAEPCVIPAEGLYVGFSFDVADVSGAGASPLLLAAADVPESFMIHSSRTHRKWIDLSGVYGAALPVTLTVDGDFGPDCVNVATLPHGVAAVGKPGTLAVTIANAGSTEVTSVDYTFAAGDIKGSGTAVLAEPLPAVLGAKNDISLKVPAFDARGEYELTFTVTAVNGNSNGGSFATASAPYSVVAILPVTRPLMEEYTGLWCMWCPRGYVAIERMNALYPDRFVALSFHNSDAMACIPEEAYPSEIDGFPSCIMNRSISTDPYYGNIDSDDVFGIEVMWKSLASAYSPVDVEAAIEWTDDSHTALRCSSTLRFADDYENAAYRVAYALVADGVTEVDGKPLPQKNAYKGAEMPGDDWTVFTSGDDYVIGLTFNDIVVAFDHTGGIDGSVPAVVEAGEPYTFSYDYTTALPNLSGKQVVTDFDKLRCVAIVLDESGNFVNSAKSPLLGAEAGTGSISVDHGTVESVEYHDLQGRRVTPGNAGLYIRTVRYTDGRAITSKVALR